jgi:hypothetical protein
MSENEVIQNERQAVEAAAEGQAPYDNPVGYVMAALAYCDSLEAEDPMLFYAQDHLEQALFFDDCKGLRALIATKPDVARYAAMEAGSNRLGDRVIELENELAELRAGLAGKGGPA